MATIPLTIAAGALCSSRRLLCRMRATTTTAAAASIIILSHAIRPVHSRSFSTSTTTTESAAAATNVGNQITGNAAAAAVESKCGSADGDYYDDIHHSALHLLTRHFKAQDALGSETAAATVAKFQLPQLDYPSYDALEPAIPQQILSLHHKAHHQAYIDNTNRLLLSGSSRHNRRDDDDDQCTSKTVGLDSYEAQKSSKKPLFFGHIIKAFHPTLYFNIGGMLNHSFLWKTLAPIGENTNYDSGSKSLQNLIAKSFGSLNAMKEQLNREAMTIIGSGWAWLVYDIEHKKLKTVKTLNQDTPFDEYGMIPVYGIDMWEHAYYLKYFNKKADYLNSLWTIVNWKFIGQNFDRILNCYEHGDEKPNDL